MKNFVFQNKTRLIFGKGQIAQLAQLMPADKKIMLTFGGGSVKKNGVYEQVIQALKGFDFTEFWGIEPNPSIETLRLAIQKGREEKVEFLLAVGGGSVLDGTKLIASALLNPDVDPWNLVLQGYSKVTMPYASVMTLPATGSEMNWGAVISRKETKEKFAFYAAQTPDFSIEDPETTFSLPKYQIANGLSDVYVHVLEQYLTKPKQSRVMDRWAEGILLTILEIAPEIMKNQHNYDLMADFMLSATLALNDMISMGVPEDWASHMIGHELTAAHDIAHGASLAIVVPGTMHVLREQKKEKLLQYAERIFGITTGTENERIDQAIAQTEIFFKSIGLVVRLTEANIPHNVIDLIYNRFKKWNVAYGEDGNVTADVARDILINRI